jgi:hypothetical protein
MAETVPFCPLGNSAAHAQGNLKRIEHLQRRFTVNEKIALRQVLRNRNRNPWESGFYFTLFSSHFTINLINLFKKGKFFQFF